MKSTFVIIAALTLTACSGAPSIQHSITTQPLFNHTTVGGANYPVVVSGAENTGVSVQQIVKSLRFPARLPANSSFKAVKDGPELINHAHLDIGANGSSTLTFLHGDRVIGVGDFSLPLNAYADPDALGSTSATLIHSMLRDSEDNLRGGRNKYSF